ncbi:hypothetical protein ACLOJK_004383 [Asimina triloba]
MTCCAGSDGCDRPDVVMPISCCCQMDAARLKLDGWVSSEPLRDGSLLAGWKNRTMGLLSIVAARFLMAADLHARMTPLDIKHDLEIMLIM